MAASARGGYARAVRAAPLILVLLLLSGCGPGEPGEAVKPPSPPSDRVRRESHLVAGHDRPALPCLEAAPSDPVPELEMGDTYFAPACVSLRGRADLRLVNRGALEHSFGVRAAGLEVGVGPGAVERVSLEELRGRGPVEIFCRFHAAAGMTGTISVA